MIKFITIFGLSLLTAFFLTPVFQKLAVKKKIYDIPTSLKRHKKPIPYLGGLSIWLSFTVPVLLFIILKDTLTMETIGIITGGTIVCGIGLIDDLKKLSSWVKLFGQSIAACILLVCDVKLKVIFFPSYLNTILTFFWIIGITNAFNIIDIMDGLSAGCAFIASMTFFFIALGTNQFLVILTTAALAGSCLGFLYYNKHPAKIFMGDAGSLFLGFTLASISISASYTAVNNIALLSPLLIFGVPIYDTFYVSLLRTLHKKSPFKGSKDHFAIRLKALGLKGSHIVLIVFLIQTALCEASYIATNVNIYGAIFIYLLVILIFIIFGKSLSKVEI